MTHVVCRWLNGEEVELGACDTIHDVKIRVATVAKKFFPDVLVLSTDYVLITEDTSTPPEKIVAIIKEEEYTASKWIGALVNHACAQDNDAIFRACQYIGSRRSTDSNATCSTVDSPTGAPASHGTPDEDEASYTVGEALRGALRTACEENIAKALKSLLVHVDVNAVIDGEMDRTSLHLAAQRGNIAVMEVLVQDQRLKPDKRDRGQLSALHHAAQHGHVRCIELIFSKHDANVNAANDYGYAVLHAASECGQSEAVEALLAVDDVNINAVTRDGWTALHVAATCGYLDVVQKLLTHPDINVNLIDRCGRTPLHAAAQVGYWDVINRLLQAPGIDVNAVTPRKVTALHLGAQNGHFNVIYTLLSSATLDVNAVNEDGATALDIAAAKGYLEVVNEFLKDPRTKAVTSW